MKHYNQVNHKKLFFATGLLLGLATLSLIVWEINHDAAIMCPRCHHIINVRSSMHLTPDSSDIEMLCDKCDYPFLLTDKQIRPDGTFSAAIDKDVWAEDYDHYLNQ